MTYRVAVAGCTGYVGGEVLRLLLAHPGVQIGAVTAGDSAGMRLGDFHPNLTPLADRVVEATSPDALAGHDVVFLALPHGASAAVASQLDAGVQLMDCGADHRLRDEAAWNSFYGTPWAGCWPYGLPEMPGQREVLAKAKRIAVPGCYPTAVTLGLLPALTHGLIEGRDVTVVAASGTSGAGKALKLEQLATEVMGSLRAYGVGGVHRHTPEILQNMAILGALHPSVSFTPILAPIPRGILAVITAPVGAELTAEQAYQVYAEAYAEEPFVQVLKPGSWPASKAVVGSNAAQIQVTIDQSTGRLVIVSTLDNLTKGTAGGAIQAMNLALGLPEITGLSMIGVAP